MPTTTLHRFPGEVVVEVLTEDEHGDLAVLTTAFTIRDDDAGTVTTTEPIPSEYRTVIAETLTEGGFTLVGDDFEELTPSTE